MSDFMDDYLTASDMQRRASLAALISLGGAVGITADAQFLQTLAPWLLPGSFYSSSPHISFRRAQMFRGNSCAQVAKS